MAKNDGGWTAFVSPIDKSSLKDNGDGSLIDQSGNSFPVKEGIPDLTYPQDLPEEEESSKDFYDARPQAYDENLHMTFKTHGEDEQEVREGFIDALEIGKGDKVLEVACGTGRDSVLIADRLGKDGELGLQDISPKMLERCVEKLKDHELQKDICVSNASYLPFPDDHFDATYSFGALGEFSDIHQALKEMVRVTKTGGKIVIGDESMPPWLRGTYFSNVLMTTNPQFAAELPLSEIPVEAREFRLRYVIGGVFYLIDFRVGEGEPEGNFDFEIPGFRGGTLRTRYEGRLEGVDPETKEKVHQLVKEKGTSVHDWLDQVVREAAENELKKK